MKISYLRAIIAILLITPVISDNFALTAQPQPSIRTEFIRSYDSCIIHFCAQLRRFAKINNKQDLIDNLIPQIKQVPSDIYQALKKLHIKDSTILNLARHLKKKNNNLRIQMFLHQDDHLGANKSASGEYSEPQDSIWIYEDVCGGYYSLPGNHAIYILATVRHELSHSLTCPILPRFNWPEIMEKSVVEGFAELLELYSTDEKYWGQFTGSGKYPDIYLPIFMILAFDRLDQALDLSDERGGSLLFNSYDRSSLMREWLKSGKVKELCDLLDPKQSFTPEVEQYLREFSMKFGQEKIIDIYKTKIRSKFK